jgi:hypothetical protein
MLQVGDNKNKDVNYLWHKWLPPPDWHHRQLEVLRTETYFCAGFGETGSGKRQQISKSSESLIRSSSVSTLHNTWMKYVIV